MANKVAQHKKISIAQSSIDDTIYGELCTPMERPKANVHILEI